MPSAARDPIPNPPSDKKIMHLSLPRRGSQPPVRRRGTHIVVAPAPPPYTRRGLAPPPTKWNPGRAAVVRTTRWSGDPARVPLDRPPHPRFFPAGVSPQPADGRPRWRRARTAEEGLSCGRRGACCGCSLASRRACQLRPGGLYSRAASRQGRPPSTRPWSRPPY